MTAVALRAEVQDPGLRDWQQQLHRRGLRAGEVAGAGERLLHQREDARGLAGEGRVRSGHRCASTWASWWPTAVGWRP